MGCVRETPDIKKEEVSSGCVRETPRIKRSQHGMCKRNYLHKNEGSLGCVRETTRIKIKEAWNVSDKLPAQK